jgi:hypothetical protein
LIAKSCNDVLAPRLSEESPDEIAKLRKGLQRTDGYAFTMIFVLDSAFGDVAF